MSPAAANHPLSEDDLSHILEWNQSLPDAAASCVYTLIETHARTRPDAQAVCGWDGELTYSQLDDLANRLAGLLVSKGVTVEKFVPLCFEKSAWIVVSLLAVLKAGGAIVLIDPSFPKERIQSMLSDIKSELLICSPATIERMKDVCPEEQLVAVPPVFLEDSKSTPYEAKLAVLSDHAAVCLFTSGSTGKPKGIVQEHRTTAFSAQVCAETFGIGHNTRVLQWAAYCFDMSIIDMLMTLVGGGCVCIPSEDQRMNDLAKVMCEMQVNCAAMTPSFAQTLKRAHLPSLKTLIFGGEPVSSDFLADWPPSLQIFNGYGPAESSVCVAGRANAKNPANVGRAIGARTWLVDENDYHHLVPVGHIGELMMEGPLLARGYLNDARKTEQSFLGDVSWPQYGNALLSEGRRLYASGDLAKYEADGTITLKGRKDTQIKLRGQRIETAEVEHHIHRYLPKGSSVVVSTISPSDQPEVHILVAFIQMGEAPATPRKRTEDCLVVTQNDIGVLESAVHGMTDFLASSLPAFMIPKTFIATSFIPTSPSGKIDRKSLAAYGSNLTRESPNFLYDDNIRQKGIHDAMSQSHETLVVILTEIICKLLKLQSRQISPHDDFFKLGGDSLSATKLVVEARFAGIHISVQAIFKNPTIGALASIAERSQKSTANGVVDDEKEAVQFDPNTLISRKDHSSYLALLGETRIGTPSESTDMQAFMVLSGLLSSRGYLVHFAFDISGPIDTVLLENACRELMLGHSVLCTAFALRDGRVVPKISNGDGFQMTCLSSQEPTSSLLRKLCDNEQLYEGRLGEAIPRFLLVKRGFEKNTLVMRLSHAQFDGHSLAIIYRDLQEAYRGEKLANASQFTDYATACAKANGPESEKYWRDLLLGSSMTSILQHSKPAYANVINDRLSCHFPLEPFHYTGITLVTVVKASWARVLAELSGSLDVVFGYAVTGRNLPMDGIADVVGPCNNAALTRVTFTQTNKGTTIKSLLTHIQNQYLASIPHETMSCRQIVENCTTTWPRWTRYSTSVNHQNYEDAGLTHFSLEPGPGPSTDSLTTCEISYRDLEVDRRDIQVYSWPPNTKDGTMRIDLAFCNKVLSHRLIQEMLDRLCGYVQQFVKNIEVDEPIQLNFVPESSPLRIPVAPPKRTQSHVAVQPRRIVFRYSHLDSVGIVDGVWNKFNALVNANEALMASMQQAGISLSDETTPWYQVAGDLVYAAQMSADYEAEGIKFSIEDLIECPTRKGQKEALSKLLGGLEK